MTEKIKGHILAIITVVIWSTTFIVSKILLEQFTPFQILLIRFIIAVFILSIIYPKYKKPTSIKEELIFLVIGGSLVGYFVFENSALIHTYSSNVSLIVATIPLITGVLSAIFYKKHFFNKKSILGFAIAYVGVFLIILNGNHLIGVEPIGDFFALIASLMFAVYTLILQRIKGYHIIQLTRKVFAYGTLVLVILNVFWGQNIEISSIDGSVILSFIFLGIIASSLAFLMWNKAIQIIGSVKTNQYIYLVPIITTILSAIIFSEKITGFKFIGAALIIGGLYLSEKSQGK